MRNYRLKPHLLVVVVALFAMLLSVQFASAAGGTGTGSISLTTLGTASTQDFDTLATTGADIDMTINGWYIYEDSTGGAADGQYRAGTGSDNAGDAYSFGATATAERALGSLRSGTVFPFFGASFTNNTGATITSLDISYTGEMWRAGAAARATADVLDFAYSTDATSLILGTWTDVNNLDFASPTLNVLAAGALNGNDAANQTAKSFVISSLSIPNGATFWIRWEDRDISGSDDGLAVDAFSLTPNGGAAPLTLSINDVTLAEGDAGTTAFDFTVSLSAPAGAGGVTFDIATADNTATDADNDYEPKSLTGQTIVQGNSTYTFTVTVNGDTTAEPNETFFVNVTNVTGATVNDGQGLGTITNDEITVVPIHDIQGNGAASPVDGQTKTVEAIVVGDFQDYTSDPPNELSGFFLQEEDADVDADLNTSEGIFVFDGQNPTVNVAVGDKVRVTGTVDEFGDAPDTYTELVGPLTVVVQSTGNPLPTAASIDLPVSALSEYEKYESMLVTFVDELTVTEVFTLARFGEVLLSQGGRLPNPTHAAEPGAPAQAVRDANILRSIVLDDGLTNQNPDPVRYPEPGGLSAFNTLRGGDTTASLSGVLYYLDATEDFRVQPTGTITWSHDNPRPTDAPVISGTLKIVGSNTLNFFTTVDAGPDVCGPLENQDCRGADSATEFTRQRDKLINALVEMNADVFGLVELENDADASPAGDGTDPVLEDIVSGLNAAFGAGTYDFIDTGVIGGDAIKVGLIYKTATATPVGSFSILDSSVDPNFDDSKNRPVLAQTFEDGNGERVTVAVAHLKSKGSDCGGAPDDQPDTAGGNCNGTRTAAAQAIVDWFATDPTGSGDTDFLLVGDLNSYAKEDPIDVLVNAGYVDLAADMITDPYSYVFDGEWGYLDYAMASPSLYSQVAGVAEWHINADEPIALDYNTEFKSAGQIADYYSSDPFRVSDHDPIIVGLDLSTPDTTPPDTTITNNPPNPSNSDSAFFEFTSSEPGDDFECQLDGLGWQECDGGQLTYGGLSDGSHTFEVRAIDAANNVDLTPASYTWVINTAPPSATGIYVSTTAPGSVGPLSFGSEDVLKWDGNAWSVWFDGSAAGLQANRAKHNINAFSIPDTAGDDVIMSFAQNRAPVPGIPLTVDGMDLVKWDGSDFSLYFDGSDVDLTVKTQEKIDGLQVLDGSASPINGGACVAYLLISTQGPGRVTDYTGASLKFGGEDVLGFCATNLGASTAGFWHMVLDGSAEGMPRNSTNSLSLSDDGQTLYLTTQKAFNVDSAVGGHSMVYAYDFDTAEFSGPYFIAADHGLNKKIDGLHVDGDLLP